MSPFELSALSLMLVGGSEMAQDLGIGRVWALALTSFVSLAFFVFRKALGELFFPRLIRFMQLPSILVTRLQISGRKHDKPI